MKLSRRIPVLALLLSLSSALMPLQAMADTNSQVSTLNQEQKISNVLLGTSFAISVGLIIYAVSHPHHHRSSQADKEVSALAKQVADPNCPDVTSVEDRLAGEGKSALKATIELSRNQAPVIRSRAARILGEIKDRGAIKPLRAMLADPESTVKIAALDAIRATNDRGALKEVSALTMDPDPQVRSAASTALTQLQDINRNP